MNSCAYCGSQLNNLMVRDTSSLSEPMISSKVREIAPFISAGRCDSCQSITANDSRIEKFEELLKAYNDIPVGYWLEEPSKEHKALYSKIEKLVNPDNLKKSICDVGCGRGSFLQYLNERWEKTGVEPGEISRDLVKDKSIDLYTGTLENIAFPEGKFDVVSYIDVFEHLLDPIEEIKRARKILTKGGELIIYTGNASSFNSMISGKFWYYLKVFGHISIPSKEALVEALSKNGFSDIQVTITTHPSSRNFFTWLIYFVGSRLLDRGCTPLFRDHMLIKATKV